MKKILSVFLFTILAVSVTHAEGFVYTSGTGGPYKPTFTFSNTLRFNTKNNDVVELQKTLISKGYLKAEATGYFGKLTFAAVKAFQKDNKLKDDGIVGKVTKNLLIQEINAPISNGTPEVNLSPISTTVTTGGTITQNNQSIPCAVKITYLGLPTTPLVNSVSVPFYRFKLENTSSTNTCRLTEMTFSVSRNPSSISLNNFRLTNNLGNQVGTFTYNPYVNGSSMSLNQFFTTVTNGIVLSPLSSEVFTVNGDVSGVSGTTTSMSVSTKMDQQYSFSGASASNAGLILLDVTNNEYPISGTIIPQSVQVVSN